MVNLIFLQMQDHWLYWALYSWVFSDLSFRVLIPSFSLLPDSKYHGSLFKNCWFIVAGVFFVWFGFSGKCMGTEINLHFPLTLQLAAGYCLFSL